MELQKPFDDDMNIMPEPPPLTDNNDSYKFPSAEGYENVPADWKPTYDRPVPALRCTHERDDGTRCKKFGVRGTGFNGTPAMCFIHGGSLPAVKAKAEATVLSARMRLIQSVPMALDGLIDLAENANAEAIKLKAIESILDRAGLKQAVEIQVEVTNGANPSDDILKKLQIMRERSTPEPEDLGEQDENVVDEPEDEQTAPLHGAKNT